MVITIMFMLASISLLILLPIYLKKKNKIYNLQLQKRFQLIKKRKDIRSIWGIREIRDEILTIDNTHSIIVELGGIEYRLLNDEEQNNIDNNLTKIAKTFKNQMQFFSTIQNIDTTEKIEAIIENIEKRKSPNIKQYGENIIEYLNNIMQQENLYVRKNYLIISSNESYEKAKKELKELYEDLKYSLTNIKITTKVLQDIDIIELIYRELNKNSNEQLRNIIKKGGLEFYVKAKSKT